MSGIAGIARRYPTGVAVESLGRMAAAIRHRGPDGYGFYAGQSVGLAHVRLSTIDLASGAQPLTNEDGQIIVTYNGEVYNHRELRLELEAHGHVFRTRCDTEVLVHGYEEWGVELLHRLDGQFAFAIYDRDRGTLFIGRDRFGVSPLYYAQRNGDFYFGSEIKAILASGEIESALDPRGLDEVLTFGAARPPRTPFSGIASLEPGTYGIWSDGALWLRHYYELDYPEASEEPLDVIEQLDEIMRRSVGMRLRADVQVGAHLSGGLSSSITAALAQSASPYTPRSFSISSAIPEYDDTLQQQDTAGAVGTAHTASAITLDTVAQSFPDVVWHAETPLLGTGPALMYHLAKLTKESDINVVVAGGGADEIFLSSDLFRETSVRRFCLRRPESVGRQRLFERLYSDIDHEGAAESWRRFQLDVAGMRDPLFSHLPRFLSSRIGDVYSEDFRGDLGGLDVIGELRASLPTRFFGWSTMNQAAYLEMTTLLSPDLLSSRGDRMMMAHGVKGRYPFLDHRLFEFASALPVGSRMRGLRGNGVLRRWASRILPPRIVNARVSASRVPYAQGFFLPNSPAWIGDHLTPEALRRVGIFSPSAVGGLLRRCRSGLSPSFGDYPAMVGVLSTQLWHQQFVESALSFASLPASGASVLLTDSRFPASFLKARDRTSHALRSGITIRGLPISESTE
jgi:asparagine synthase (glutamine-hydrolysing)